MPNTTKYTDTPALYGQACNCRRGQERDNCPACEGTGKRINFAAIRARAAHSMTCAPNCDGSGPHVAGDVRKLPTGGSSNAILCRKCYDREIAYRRDRNQDLDPASAFLLPSWEGLAIYNA